MPARKDYETARKCTRCEVTQPLSNFYKSSKKRKDGSQTYLHLCKKCSAAKSLLQVRKTNYKKYGITEQIYEEERKKQNFSCLICENHEDTEFLGKLNIDHDHKTGKYRGLLCTNCNLGLGKFKDEPKLLKKAIEYLNAHST